MAATARSDLYSNLVRRIGYSVGLEYLFSRVNDLLDRYILRGTVDGADWRELVEKWNRLPSAQHIADVYAQLELIRKTNNTIQVLPALDVLRILISTQEHKDEDNGCLEKAQAVTFILALKIVEADGDVFLNALAANFEPQNLRWRLDEMIRHKRKKVSPLFAQAGSIRLIMESISIRNQSKSSGSAASKKQTYAERSRHLMGSNVVPSKNPISWADTATTISEDYLEKACVTRRGWAEELGLATRTGAITEKGESLLEGSEKIGLAFETDLGKAYAFWPYGYQLRKMNLSPETIDVPDLNAWDVIELLAGLFITPEKHACPKPVHESDTVRAEIIGLLERSHAIYQGSSPRGMLRHDLPLYIAEPVLAYWLSRAGAPLPRLREFIRSELQRPDRLVDLVMIRGTEGGLRLMRRGSTR
jgi:hypothetical protein